MIWKEDELVGLFIGGELLWVKWKKYHHSTFIYV